MLGFRPLDQHLGSSRSNNFNTIRLLGALQVIMAHCWYLYPDPLSRWSDGAIHASFNAMPAFFFLGGLLVTQSLDHSRTPKIFLGRRLLRLYPGIFFLFFVMAFIVGPVLTQYSLAKYFSDPGLWKYLAGCNLVRGGTTLPGVFVNTPLGPAVDTTLWSLGIELKLYLLMFLVGYLPERGKLCKTNVLILLTALFLLLRFLPGSEAKLQTVLGSSFQLYPYSHLSLYFMIGALCYRYRGDIRIYGWWLPVIMAATVLALYMHIFRQIEYILVPAAVLFFAVYGLRVGHRITPRADLSYSYYVWGWPVEQILLTVHRPATQTGLLIETVALILPIALISWYKIESPALRLKKYLG